MYSHGYAGAKKDSSGRSSETNRRSNSKKKQKKETQKNKQQKYPPIECVNDLVTCSDFRNEELEKTNTI
jgi:hypothetical protein